MMLLLSDSLSMRFASALRRRPLHGRLGFRLRGDNLLLRLGVGDYNRLLLLGLGLNQVLFGNLLGLDSQVELLGKVEVDDVGTCR